MPGQGTSRQAFRLDPELVADFKETAARADQDMSSVVRQFIGWYVRRPGVKMPKRPDPDAGARSGGRATGEALGRGVEGVDG